MNYKPREATAISKNMAAIRSKQNRTEVALRSELHRRGLRFRLYCSDIPGSPDIVFRRELVAVFVDGDFWHARILRENGPAMLRERMKTERKAYWEAKFLRNVARDDRVTGELTVQGWKVIRLWESDVKTDIGRAADRITEVLSRRRPGEAKSRSQG